MILIRIHTIDKKFRDLSFFLEVRIDLIKSNDDFLHTRLKLSCQANNLGIFHAISSYPELTMYVLLLTKGQSMWNDIGWQHPNDRGTLSQNTLNSIRSYNIHDVAQSFKNWHLFARDTLRSGRTSFLYLNWWINYEYTIGFVLYDFANS